jgi:hypothetical protein
MKPKPNIPKLPFNNRGRLKTLIEEVISDTFIYQHVPDEISFPNGLIRVVLLNKKFSIEEMNISSPKSYTDVYLQGIKQRSDGYEINLVDNNIVIEFNSIIAYRQSELNVTDFIVKGKIVSI